MGFSIYGSLSIEAPKDVLDKASGFISNKYPQIKFNVVKQSKNDNIEIWFDDTWANLYTYCRFVLQIKKEIPELHISSEAESFYSVVGETRDVSLELPSGYFWDDDEDDESLDNLVRNVWSDGDRIGESDEDEWENWIA